MQNVSEFQYTLGSFFPEQGAHDLSAEDIKVVEDFHKLYFKLLEKKSGLQISWLGHQTGKVPGDLWVYQEILTRNRPDIIIETGTHWGGSALFLATICSILGHGEVVSIDLYQKDPLPNHGRITYLQGSSVSPDVAHRISDIVGTNNKVLVILDSDHSHEHVAKELNIYSKFIKKGDLLIVEDTFLGGHPSHHEYGAGPTEAIEQFLNTNDEFYIDRSYEKFLFTLNYKGFLRRKS